MQHCSIGVSSVVSLALQTSVPFFSLPLRNRSEIALLGPLLLSMQTFVTSFDNTSAGFCHLENLPQQHLSVAISVTPYTCLCHSIYTFITHTQASVSL